VKHIDKRCYIRSIGFWNCLQGLGPQPIRIKVLMSFSTVEINVLQNLFMSGRSDGLQIGSKRFIIAVLRNWTIEIHPRYLPSPSIRTQERVHVLQIRGSN